MVQILRRSFLNKLVCLVGGLEFALISGIQINKDRQMPFITILQKEELRNIGANCNGRYYGLMDYHDIDDTVSTKYILEFQYLSKGILVPFRVVSPIEKRDLSFCIPDNPEMLHQFNALEVMPNYLAISYSGSIPINDCKTT